MLQDPGLDRGEMAAELRRAYGPVAREFTFVPGFDMRAAAYHVATDDGSLFMKVSFDPIAEAPLEVARALRDAGIASVLAPMRTLLHSVAHPIGERRTMVIYPYVTGRNGTEVAMGVEQWRAFGSDLRAVHDSGLEDRFLVSLPAEQFALPSADALPGAMDPRPAIDSPAGNRLHAFLREHRDRIGAMVERAQELGSSLAGRQPPGVLCHGDIHAANLLVVDGDGVYLVDWDTARIAPRERDLLFIVGSRIARTVEPHEEAWFFEGYGSADVDPEAITYFRYERIIEDIGEFARSVFTDADLPESSREAQVRLTESFFEPGGDLDSAEQVVLR